MNCNKTLCKSSRSCCQAALGLSFWSQVRHECSLASMWRSRRRNHTRLLLRLSHLNFIKVGDKLRSVTTKSVPPIWCNRCGTSRLSKKHQDFAVISYCESLTYLLLVESWRVHSILCFKPSTVFHLTLISIAMPLEIFVWYL